MLECVACSAPAAMWSMPMFAIPSQKGRELYGFGPFRIDPEKGILLRGGEPVPLTPKTFQILLVLIRHSAEVVSKDELLKSVWPDTFVEEANLSRNIFMLRKALGDSAQDRYIVTVPGRGYRLAESVHLIPDSELNIVAASHSKLEVQVKETRGWAWTVAAVLAATVMCGGILAVLHLRSVSRQIQVQQLTTNSAEDPVWHAVISPDGKYAAYGDLAGIQVRTIATGESHLLPRPKTLSAGDAWFPAAWSADGTRIFATSITSTASTAWAVSVIGGAAARLRENALVQSGSPDGSLIVFITSNYMNRAENSVNQRLVWNSEVWTMGSGGENAKRVLSGDNLTYFGSVRWSPDGKRIGYQRFHLINQDAVDYTIEICDLNGGTPSVVFLKRHYRGVSLDHIFPEDFCWLADGRIVYAVREASPNSRDSNLWEVAVDTATGRLRSQPRKITNLAGFHMEGLSNTADGTRLLFETSTDQSYVYVGRLAANGKLENPQRLTPDERYNTPQAWTGDSKSVIFRSDRTGSFLVYKQALDEKAPELVPTGSGTPELTRASPDGTWLIYSVLPNADSSPQTRLMRVPLAGGPPQVIFETTAVRNFYCAHYPGSSCVMAESSSSGKEDVFFSFDPAFGTRHELFRIALNPINWALSPDGSRLAITGDDPEGRIEVRSARTGQIETRIKMRGWPSPFAVDWAMDGKTLFVSHSGLMDSPSGPIGTTLLRVDLEGHVQPIWESRGGRYTWGIPSPDGKYLAIRGATTGRNAWMITNF